MHPREWLEVRPEGLYCKPGGFYIDPTRPVERAVITHGHADHARGGHKHSLATPQTLDIMHIRYGPHTASQAVEYGESVVHNGVGVTLLPAGHILGSAQVVMEYAGSRAIVSGDFKRAPDATCPPFTPMNCDVFITEATFGLPVFQHPPLSEEIKKLLDSVELFPNSAHLVGVYALGKCQRVLLGLREAGYVKPIYLHGAVMKLTEYYQSQGMDFGELVPATVDVKKKMDGGIILGPPSAIGDRWSRRFPDPIFAIASGWMQIRARAKQKRIDLPLIISDHADWDGLTQTLHDVNPGELWVTHGREEALVHYAEANGYKAQALSLLGYEDDDE